MVNYSCDKCYKTFTQKSHYTQHQKQNHQNDLNKVQVGIRGLAVSREKHDPLMNKKEHDENRNRLHDHLDDNFNTILFVVSFGYVHLHDL